MGYALKVKTKKGQHVLSTVDADSTIDSLKTQLSLLTEIHKEFIHVLVGFPPKALDLSNPQDSVKRLGISNGDTLIVEEKVGGIPADPQKEDQVTRDAQLARNLAAADESDEFNGVLMKKVVPADNSCLFTSIGK